MICSVSFYISMTESQQNAEAHILFEERSPKFHVIKREVSSRVSGSTVDVCDIECRVDIAEHLNELNCLPQGKY